MNYRPKYITIPIDEARRKRIRKACSQNGVSISEAGRQLFELLLRGDVKIHPAKVEYMNEKVKN